MGTGKSTLAAQLGFYLTDGKITLDDVVFSPDEFVTRLKIAKPGSCIILDEAFDAVNRRTALSNANMKILSIMQRMRIKKVFILLVLPSYYDLDKNLILNIADLLFHCSRKDFGRRGGYGIYKRERLKTLWLRCRQYYNYPLSVASPNIIARFPKFFPFDIDEYKAKKEKSLEQEDKKSKKNLVQKYINQRNQLVYLLKDKNIKTKDIAISLKVTQHNIRKIYNDMKEKKQEEEP